MYKDILGSYNLNLFSFPWYFLDFAGIENIVVVGVTL